MPCLMQNRAMTASKHELCHNWRIYCALCGQCFKMCIEKAKSNRNTAKYVVVGHVCFICCHFQQEIARKTQLRAENKIRRFSYYDRQIIAQKAMPDAEQSYDRFKAPSMSQLAYILRIVCTLLQIVHWKGQKGLKYSQICSCCPCLLDLLPFSSKNSEKGPIESREWKSDGFLILTCK